MSDAKTPSDDADSDDSVPKTTDVLRREILERTYATPHGVFGVWPLIDSDVNRRTRTQAAEELRDEGLVAGQIGADGLLTLKITASGRRHVERVHSTSGDSPRYVIDETTANIQGGPVASSGGGAGDSSGGGGEAGHAERGPGSAVALDPFNPNPPDGASKQSDDHYFARMAIDEARKSIHEDDGRLHPKVGAVVVRNGKIVGKAHRGERGRGDHGEYTLLEKKLPEEVLVDSTVYVTLEPCTVRTHPKVCCAARLLERKVARVVIGMVDPDKRITGRGIELLRSGRVEIGHFPEELAAEVEELNRDWIRDIKSAPEPKPRASRKRLVVALIALVAFVVAARLWFARGASSAREAANGAREASAASEREANVGEARLVVEFADPANPVFAIANVGNAVARDPKYEFVLFDLDKPDIKPSDNPRLNLRMPATLLADYILPGSLLGPSFVFDLSPLQAQVAPGDRVFGYVFVQCSNCRSLHYEWVYIERGKSGWAKDMLPAEIDRARLLADVLYRDVAIDKVVSPEGRTAFVQR